MQTKSPIFDDIAELMTGAAGAVASTGEEMRSVARSRMDRLVADMDLVSREEFDLVREMVLLLKQENAELRLQIDALKEPKPAKRKTPVRKTATKKT